MIVGTVTAVAAVDWGGDASEKVTTAADKPADEQSVPGDTKKAAVDPSPTDRAEHGGKGKDDPNVVYVPVSGGAGAGTGGTEKSASDNDDRSDSGGTTGGTSGSTGTTGSTGTEEKKSTTTQNTDSGSTSGYLWADGSVGADTNDFWDESTVTVKSTEPITSLKVVVRIIQTGGVKSTGTWTSLGDKAAVGQNADSDQIGYVITLKSGVTLAPGTYVFKVQYDHAQGRRDAGRDLYTVTAVANGSDDESLSGRF